MVNKRFPDSTLKSMIAQCDRDNTARGLHPQMVYIALIELLEWRQEADETRSVDGLTELCKTAKWSEAYGQPDREP